MIKYLDLSPELKEALESQKPIVALESTIISHGMPYPQNVAVAHELENIIRNEGAVPATIGIMGGKLKLGLSSNEIDILAKSPAVAKVSRRDIPFVLAQNSLGATTVASTMIIAKLAGIKVFVTGGIGGVHRGAQESFDISADLQELAKTELAVVCAGAKSILDLELSLEYLETQGVPVVGYQTDRFPAFFSRTSPFPVDYRFDSVAALAQSLQIKWQLGLGGGVVIANPIPEEFALDASQIELAIAGALREAAKRGIKGKAITPFLLSKVKEMTGGKSLEANIELVYNNARLGARLAVAMDTLG